MTNPQTVPRPDPSLVSALHYLRSQPRLRPPEEAGGKRLYLHRGWTVTPLHPYHGGWICNVISAPAADTRRPINTIEIATALPADAPEHPLDTADHATYLAVWRTQTLIHFPNGRRAALGRWLTEHAPPPPAYPLAQPGLPARPAVTLDAVTLHRLILQVHTTRAGLAQLLGFHAAAGLLVHEQPRLSQPHWGQAQLTIPGYHRSQS
ncbi:hypothetical protein KIF24_16860 [Micromonospora sp. Llam7]|uniref:hypothetical protein n=1 Tax=Micromonospora tarapacensis TaxID=2835305 RepID=UPI001C8395B5|nr:hypothetical protein [Micromonospora tarapacensis]MBX7267535.1 hypothetical protein [Micromonospora tarapacensis]